MLRRAKGLEPNKFLFSVVINDATNVPAGFTSLTVEWKRGRKIVFTQAALVSGGRASFNQELKMVCTLYQDPKDKTYQEKTTRFVVRQRLGKSKKKVGEVEIDLANYANKEGPLDAPTLTLALGSSSPAPTLSVMVRSHWVGDGDDSEGSECSDMSRCSVDTSMSGASMASSTSDQLRLSTNSTTPSRATQSPAVQKAAQMASLAKSPLPTTPTRAPPGAAGESRASASSSPPGDSTDNREAAMLRNENRRLAAELKAAQLSLSAARKERDISRDECRKLKETMRQQGAVGAVPMPSPSGGDAFGVINRADGTQERADRAVLDSLSADDLRSILAAREAELGAVKIRWADSETERETAEHKVRRIKKMLHKVGVERDSLARKVSQLEVQLYSR